MEQVRPSATGRGRRRGPPVRSVRTHRLQAGAPE